MSRYGKGMRSCCDSVADQGTPHIRGCENAVKATAADPVEVMRQARLWIAGQPWTRTSTITTQTQMVDTLTAAIGEPLEGWE